jgi:WD40 repeat protein
MIIRALKEINGHNGAIYDCVISNQSCYTTSADKFVARWDLKTGQQDNFAAKLEVSGYRLALNLNKKLLAVGNASGGIHLIDLSTKKEIRYLTQHQTAVFALTYSSKNNQFYSADANGVFCVWNGDTFDLELTLPILCGKVRQIVLNETEEVLAFGGQDQQIYLFETKFFNPIGEWRAHKDGVNTLAFKGDDLFSGGKDAYLRKWNWRNQALIKEIPAHNYALYDLLWMKDKNILVSASFDKTIKLWNPDDLSLYQRLERKQGGHTHVVNRLQKIDENHFISVGDDRKIIHWSIEEF